MTAFVVGGESPYGIAELPDEAGVAVCKDSPKALFTRNHLHKPDAGGSPSV